MTEIRRTTLRFVALARLLPSGRFWIVYDSHERKCIHVLGDRPQDASRARELAGQANLAFHQGH